MNNCLNNKVRLIVSIKKFKGFVEGVFLMKILAFLVAFLYGVAFVLAFIGSRADNLSVKEAFSKLSSALAVVALLIGTYGGLSMTLSSTVSSGEGKFKTVTNNEIRYFDECKKENGHNICTEDSGKEVVVEDFWEIN